MYLKFAHPVDIQAYKHLFNQIMRELQVMIQAARPGRNKLCLYVKERNEELSDIEIKRRLNEASDRLRKELLKPKKATKEFTHFVSIPMTMHPIRARVQQFFESIEADDPSFDKEFKHILDTIHLTLAPLSLTTKAKQDEAVLILKQCWDSCVVDRLKDDPSSFNVRLKGLQTMKGSRSKARVLYAKVCTEDGQAGANSLQTFADILAQKYHEADLLKDDQVHIKLHMTLMNSSQRKGKNKFKPFDVTRIFDQLADFDFGTVSIRQTDISDYLAKRGPNQYYRSLVSLKL